MKKFILAALAASVIAAPVAAQPFNGRGNRAQQVHTVKVTQRGSGRQMVQYRTTKVQQRQWMKGQRFDYRQARNYRQINPRAYRLHDAPNGYRWVQSGNDAVLVGVTSGIIAAVLANLIR
jgi:Ni/Co efflux regulator RcnB